MSSNPRSL